MGLKEKLRERWNTREEQMKKRRFDEYQKLIEEEERLDEGLRLIKKRRQVKGKRRQANPITRRLFAEPKPKKRERSPKKKRSPKKRSRKRQPTRAPQEPEFTLPDLDGPKRKKKGLPKL